MDRDEARKRAEVMFAYANGEQIQIKRDDADEWDDVLAPRFHSCYEYRVKAKQISGWAKVYDHPDGFSLGGLYEEKPQRFVDCVVACIPVTFTIGEGIEGGRSNED